MALQAFPAHALLQGFCSGVMYSHLVDSLCIYSYWFTLRMLNVRVALDSKGQKLNMSAWAASLQI